jgi:FtsP/CotA-like multicopper oxidase with cupredoxin domain
MELCFDDHVAIFTATSFGLSALQQITHLTIRSLNPPLIEGQENPMRRDTVVIQPHHSATLRFVANNPGAWLFHCESSLR